MSKDKKIWLIVLTAIAVSLALISQEIALIATRNSKKPIVVIRIDDVQDYAFRDAQLYLLDYNIANNVTASLAIIPKEFGSDKALVDTVESALRSGSEAAVHGWEHENFTQLPPEEQETQLQMGKLYLKAILDVDVTVFAPPMLGYNENTTAAMSLEGYKIITGLSDLQPPSLAQNGILSLPATVELADYANSTWKVRSFEEIKREINSSILIYGYASILIHPQGFISNDTLNQTAVEVYENIVQYLKPRFSFSTFENLSRKFLGFAPYKELAEYVYSELSALCMLWFFFVFCALATHAWKNASARAPKSDYMFLTRWHPTTNVHKTTVNPQKTGNV